MNASAHPGILPAAVLCRNPEAMNFGLAARPGRNARPSQGDGIQQGDAGLRFSAWLVKGLEPEVSETQLGVEKVGWVVPDERQAEGHLWGTWELSMAVGQKELH